MKRDGVYWYDENAAGNAIEFFPRHLRHIEGPLAGDRVELAPWHKREIVGPLFGWKRPHSCKAPKLVPGTRICTAIDAGGFGQCEFGLRRYRELELFVPRKNAKTTVDMGIALILLCADDEMGAQVYLAAFDKDQAAIGFNIAATMVEQSPTLKKKLRVLRSKLRIAYGATDSFLEAIPAVAAGAVGFNAHGISYDEYQTAVSDDLDDALDGGTAARRQPVLMRSMTAGETINSPAGRLYLRMKDVIAGIREARDDELIVLHEAKEDADPQDLATWIAANPGYGVSVQPSFVKKQMRKALEEPSKRADIYRYGLNRWPDYTDAELPLETWDECGQIVSLEQLAGRTAYVGVGISSALDLGAVALLFPAEDGEPARVVMEHFIPAKTVARNEKSQDAPPWREWIAKGWLELVAGETLDYTAIEKLILEDYMARFNVREIVVNPRGAAQLMANLMAQDAPVVMLTPSYKSMSPAWNELERLVTTKGIHHGGNAALRFQMSKLRLKRGPSNDEKTPDREASKTNIEGVIALLSALNRAVVGSAEEEQGEWTAV